MTATRIRCCIPFCEKVRANARPEFDEWICGDHWRLIDKTRRQVWGRLQKQWRRFGPPPGAAAIYDRLWAALKRQATERAMGISA